MSPARQPESSIGRTSYLPPLSRRRGAANFHGAVNLKVLCNHTWPIVELSRIWRQRRETESNRKNQMGCLTGLEPVVTGATILRVTSFASDTICGQQQADLIQNWSAGEKVMQQKISKDDSNNPKLDLLTAHELIFILVHYGHLESGPMCDSR